MRVNPIQTFIWQRTLKWCKNPDKNKLYPNVTYMYFKHQVMTLDINPRVHKLLILSQSLLMISIRIWIQVSNSRQLGKVKKSVFMEIDFYLNLLLFDYFSHSYTYILKMHNKGGYNRMRNLNLGILSCIPSHWPFIKNIIQKKPCYPQNPTQLPLTPTHEWLTIVN